MGRQHSYVSVSVLSSVSFTTDCAVPLYSIQHTFTHTHPWKTQEDL